MGTPRARIEVLENVTYLGMIISMRKYGLVLRSIFLQLGEWKAHAECRFLHKNVRKTCEVGVFYDTHTHTHKD